MGKTSMFKKYILPFVLTAAVCLMAGCEGDTTATSVSDPNPNPFNPKGTVSGVLRDAVTQTPLSGAVVRIMDRASTTDSAGIFLISNVPALNGAGNEPGNGNAPYPVVIDMAAVNAKITTGAKYPAIVYSAVTPVYTSLGDAAPGGNASNQTNHDTPVDGFVANIMPVAGKLDATIKMQVVNTRLQPVSGATVTIFSAIGSNNNTTGAGIAGTPGHLVATATSAADGFVTFAGLEAKQSFVIKAVSSAGSAEGWYGNYAIAGGAASPAGQGAAAIIVAPSDNLTDVYAVQGGAAYNNVTGAFFNNGLVIGTVDGVAPFLLTVSPSNLADIVAPTTGTLDFVFTFSEPIQSTNYANALTRDAAVNGGLYNHVTVNYLGPKTGNIAHTLAWSADRTQLTVSIPAASITAQSRYQVSIAAACANGLGALQLKDANGNNFAAVPAAAVCNITTSGGFNVAAPVVSKTNASNSLAIEWPSLTNAASYNVYWSIVNRTPYRAPLGRAALVADNAAALGFGGVFNVAGFPTFNLTAIPGFNLANGVTYAVKVVAVNGQGSESEFSNEQTFSETAPGVVAGITKTAQATDVTSYTYTWTAGTNAVSYNVYLEPVVGGTGMGYQFAVNTPVPTVELSAQVAAITAANGYTSNFNKGQQVVTWNVKVTAVAPFGSESAPTVAATGIVDQTRAAIATAVQTTVATGVAVRAVAAPVAGTIAGAATTGTGTLTITFNKTMNYTDLNTLANWSMSAPAGSTGTTFAVTAVTPAANGLSAVISYSYSIATAAILPANTMAVGNAPVSFLGKTVTALAVNNIPF